MITVTCPCLLRFRLPARTSAREHVGVSGGTKNGFADFASTALRFPSMCVRASNAETSRGALSRWRFYRLEDASLAATDRLP